MSEFQRTPHGQRAVALIADIADHLREAFGVEPNDAGAVKAIPDRPGDGYVPFVRDGVTAYVDIPLSKFVSDMTPTEALASLPEPVRNAIEIHARRVERHCLQVGVVHDTDALAAIGDWDWSAGLPVVELRAAGFDDLVYEAKSEAEFELDWQVLRIRIAAMDHHFFRSKALSVVVTANTEFEGNLTGAELVSVQGPRHDRERVDHRIVDVDFATVSEFTDAKAIEILSSVANAFPAMPSSSPRMG